MILEHWLTGVYLLALILASWPYSGNPDVWSWYTAFAYNSLEFKVNTTVQLNHTYVRNIDSVTDTSSVCQSGWIKQQVITSVVTVCVTTLSSTWNESARHVFSKTQYWTSVLHCRWLRQWSTDSILDVNNYLLDHFDLPKSKWDRDDRSEYELLM
jgi:hypothetical protein